MPPEVVETALRDQALRSLDRLPPFSPILNRLLAQIATEDVSFSEVASLIENDTVMAGNVLKIVNSAMYGFQGTVNSVRHAVAILGVTKLRNLCLSLSIARMWGRTKMPEGWSGAKFNAHSMATAVLSDLIVQRTGVPYPEGAFTAGLLHDVGKLLLAVSLPSEFARIREMAARTGEDETSCELDITGFHHAELSGVALQRWNLPEPIQAAATFHHTPEVAGGGEPHLSYVVAAANRLAKDLGHSVLERGEAGEPAVPDPAASRLGLEDHLPAILADFEMEFEVLKGFL